MLFRTVLAVAGVLVLAYWCSVLLKKQWVKSSGDGNMRLLEHIQVGQNQRILLLKVGEHTYLIGVSQAGIRFLTEVEGDFQPKEPVFYREAVPQIPFQEILKKYMPPHQGKKGEKDE
ncbi:MAG: flagellar biosynthetic protein FliO [Hungatella sp.]|nr:flagellar biosynthetic protein FliO [Hungatella sp.]